MAYFDDLVPAAGPATATAEPPLPDAPTGAFDDLVPPPSATVTPQFREVLKGMEGFAPKATWDYKQYSVGYGTRGKPGEQLTREQAEARLEEELKASAATVDDAARRFGYDLTPNQRDALISFDFNTGSAESALGYGSGDLDLVTAKMAEFTKVTDRKTGKKVFNQGLDNRRKKEIAWFKGADPVPVASVETGGAGMFDDLVPAGPMTRQEFGAQQAALAQRDLGQRAGAFGDGVVAGARQIGRTVLNAGAEALSDPLGTLTQLPATVTEGATRGTFDLLDLGRRVVANDLAALPEVLSNPASLALPETRKRITSALGLMDKEEKLQRDYDKYLTNLGYQQARTEGLDEKGNVAPQWFGPPQPSVAEGLSLVLDPTLAVPIAGQVGRMANAGRRMIAGAAAPVARGVETAGRAVNTGIRGGIDAGISALERRGISPTAAQAAAGTVGAGSLITQPGQILAGTMAGAKTAEMGASAVRAVAEEAPILSQLRISERIARDINRPGWLRRAASAATGIPEPLTRTAGAAVEGAMQGAALGGGLALAAGEDAEGIGAGVGSGGLLGAAGGAIGSQLPAARRNARLRSEDGDIIRLLDRQQLLGGAADRLAAVPREELVRIATLDRILSDGADIVVLDGPTFQQTTGLTSAAGVFRETTPDGRQRLTVNLDGGVSVVRAVAHEVGHALTTHPAVNRDTVHLGIDGAYGEAGLIARGREYAQRLLEAERATQPPPLVGSPTAGEVSGAPRLPLSSSEIEARFQQLRTDAAARGDVDGLGWVRDELFAEHLAAEIDGKAWGIDQLRGKLPPGADVSALRETWWGIKQRLLDAFGVPYTETGRLALPESTVFRDNPLVSDPALRRMVARAQQERTAWLRGLEKTEDPETPKGAPLLREAGAQSLTRNPAVEWRPLRDGSAETDFAVRDAQGRVRFKTPEEIARVETARAKQAQALVPKTTLPAGDSRMGPKVIDGRNVITGDTLPPLFDVAENFSPETRAAARALEAARAEGGTFSLWYHQIGSGSGGTWRQAVRTRLGNVAATQREVSLVGWEMTKAGNIIGKVLDVGAARQRAFELAEAGRLELWGGSVDAFQGDVLSYLANHAAGRPGDMGLGQAKRDFINGFFGVSTRANRAANPLSGSFGRSLIKSFRLDRMNHVQPTGRQGWGVSYPRMRDNLLPAYHGTPHKVDRFSLDKIGTGEGAQVYGWGLYFAENPDVATSYATKLGNNAASGDPLVDMAKTLLSDGKRRNIDVATTIAEKMGIPLKEAAAAVKQAEAAGNTYAVDLKVEPEQLLDWDKPLSEQSPQVRKALLNDPNAARYEELQGTLRKLEAQGRIDSREWTAAVDESRALREQLGFAPTMSGEDFYREMAKAGSPAGRWGLKRGLPSSGFETASAYLASLGIPGLRYLDQGSRPGFGIVKNTDGTVRVVDQKGIYTGPIFKSWEAASAYRDKLISELPSTRNFVLWDESKIQITHENGQPVSMAEAMQEQGERAETGYRIPESDTPAPMDTPAPSLSPVSGIPDPVLIPVRSLDPQSRIVTQDLPATEETANTLRAAADAYRALGALLRP